MQFSIWSLRAGGAACFGLVIGWLTYRTLRLSARVALSQLASVLGMLGGGAVTLLFPASSGVFGSYCIGLAIGFFGHAIAALGVSKSEAKSVDAWLGKPPPTAGFESSGAEQPSGEFRGQMPESGSGEASAAVRGVDLGWSNDDFDSEISGESWEGVEESTDSTRRGAPSSEPPVASPAPAPRVLNANFAEPARLGDSAPWWSRVLNEHQGLIADREYELLVDVGPRWKLAPSAVVGDAYFPIDRLPPVADGYEVHVVVVSEEFTPRTSSGWIWVPRDSAPSSPIIDGRRADSPGPLRLTLRAPTLPTPAEPKPDLGRLCLYYENNLLQSAVIRAGVIAAPRVPPASPIAFEVDYVLSTNFSQLETLARRELRFGPADDDGSHPVGLNLTLNGDGAGKHRIVVKNSSLPPGWMSYDPGDATDALDRARDALASCYWLKDVDNSAVLLGPDQKPRLGLGRDLGKSNDQFKLDLVNLAKIGSELFGKVFLQIQPEGGGADDAQKWIWNLRTKVLADSSVIQIARTGPANYVFPWGLIYQHPLDKRANYRMCPIVDEEWNNDAPGPRIDPMTRKRCKYHDEASHEKNIICPYGFWGLKHIIEQPPTELADPKVLDAWSAVNRHVNLWPPVTLGVAVADDPTFDRNLVAGHLRKLGSLTRLSYSPPPAGDWDTVLAMLKSPSVAYFLCHDQWDAAKRDSYLSLGPLDASSSQRVYANELVDWVLQQDPDKWEWRKRRPLVFINACHSADLRPGRVLNFVSVFARAGAAGVIGSEVSMLLSVAVAAGESMLTELVAGRKVGEAMRAMRWELARKGNLLGLAYTMYCLADLDLIDASASSTPPGFTTTAVAS
jgi:CHAT domain